MHGSVVTEIVDSAESDLRALGKNEAWLHDGIMANPSRLGLGQVEIVAHELIQSKNSGGRLDILAHNEAQDTYYEIEVMLGECDASHGFRTLDYWARERAAHPNSRHFAVLVAENLQGRYKTVLETLPQFIPFIGVEIRTFVLASEPPHATVRAAIVHSLDELLETARQPQPGKSGEVSLVPRDEETWRTEVTDACWRTMQGIYDLAHREFGPTRIDYGKKFYVGLYKGWRCWCPMAPRVEGVAVHLPDGGTTLFDERREDDDGPGPGVVDKDHESATFLRVKALLATVGIQASWVWTYNGGANPVFFALRPQDVERAEVQDILRQAYASV